MKNTLYSAALIATLLFTSCASELDTAPAGSAVSDEQIKELFKKDPERVLSPMMLGAVGYMHNGARRDVSNVTGFMIWNLGMDLQGNDMVLTKLTNWFRAEYIFSNLRGQTNALTADRWYCFYKIVNQCNRILDLIPDDATGKVLIYKAQALTYRAMAYYYLMCIYQDDYLHGGKDKAGVPLYLKVEGSKARTASTEVYKQITADLKTAIKLFTDGQYDPMATTSDIDQSVANMVLARVTLTTGEYETAASAAQVVIDTGYELMNEEQYTESGFQKTSLPETIWGYTWSEGTTNGNQSFASYMSISAIPYANNKGVYTAIDQRLYDQIPATDYRKKNFLAAAVGSIPKYTNVKFNSEDYNQDEIYMRLSEAYLLRAEALARQGGHDADAQQVLYDLVSKRDTGYIKSTKTGADLLNEIFLQSRIELWGEGHEFFTNKRFNVGVDRTTSANHTPKLVKPAGKNFTYQIPLSIELNSNPYINESDQNPL